MQSPVKIWRNQKNIAKLLGRVGKIISWTVIRVPPGDFMDQAPYPVVIVTLDNGTRITAQLVDFGKEHLNFGQRVSVVVRRITQPDSDGIIPYGVKVKPI